MIAAPRYRRAETLLPAGPGAAKVVSCALSPNMPE